MIFHAVYPYAMMFRYVRATSEHDSNCFEEVEMSKRLLRLRQVLDLVPVSKSTWYAGIEAKRFPRGRKLTDRCTVWSESAIDAVVEGTWQEEDEC